MSRKRRFFSYLLWSLSSLFVVLCLIIFLSTLFLNHGFYSDFFNQKLENAFNTTTESWFKSRIVKSSLSWGKNLDLDIGLHMSIDPVLDAITLRQTGIVHARLSPLTLVQGKSDFLSLNIEKFHFLIEKQEKANHFYQLPKDDFGRIDFDAVSDKVFYFIDSLSKKFHKQSIRSLSLQNITVTFQKENKEQDNKEQESKQTFVISNASIDWEKQQVNFQAEIIWNGEKFQSSGSVTHDPDKNEQKFSLQINDIPVDLGKYSFLIKARPHTITEILTYLGEEGKKNSRDGTANIFLSGKKLSDIPMQTLAVGLVFTEMLSFQRAETTKSEERETKFEVRAFYNKGDQIIKIVESRVKLGGLVIPFVGNFGLQSSQRHSQKDGDSQKDNDDFFEKYYFDLTSLQAISAPEDSLEQPLLFQGNLTGSFSTSESELRFKTFNLQTKTGSLQGSGQLKFATTTPEIYFQLQIPKMSVLEAKQLWPVLLAPSARKWVLSHIKNGEIIGGKITVNFAPDFFIHNTISDITGKEVAIHAQLKGMECSFMDQFMPFQLGKGLITVSGTKVRLILDDAEIQTGKKAIKLSKGRLLMDRPGAEDLFLVDLEVSATGASNSFGEFLEKKFGSAFRKLSFDLTQTAGNVQTVLTMHFPIFGQELEKKELEKQKLEKQVLETPINWRVKADFDHISLANPYLDKMHMKDLAGSVAIDNEKMNLKFDGLMNEIPVSIEKSFIIENFVTETSEIYEKDRSIENPDPAIENNVDQNEDNFEKITLRLDDSLKNKIFPGLEMLIKGDINVEIGKKIKDKRRLQIDLSKTRIEIPWMGWQKGSGIAAKASLTVPAELDQWQNIHIDDFAIEGKTFEIYGKIILKDGAFSTANFSKFHLNRDDKAALLINKKDSSWNIALKAQFFDIRSIIKRALQPSFSHNKGAALSLTAKIDKVRGFHEKKLKNLYLSYEVSSSKKENFTLKAATESEHRIAITMISADNQQFITVSSEDAGGFFRFIDFYDKIYGGQFDMRLQMIDAEGLKGPIRISDFQIVNEPRLASIASARPAGGGKSFHEVLQGKVDVSHILIQQADAYLTKGDQYLLVDKGMIRGPKVGATFQGIVRDSFGNMNITGTFMPGYALNRLFANLPFLGTILGNGRDRGLIGITFKLEGKSNRPRIIVNPISVIAPGVFRSIFEFN